MRNLKETFETFTEDEKDALYVVVGNILILRPERIELFSLPSLTLDQKIAANTIIDLVLNEIQEGDI